MGRGADPVSAKSEGRAEYARDSCSAKARGGEEDNEWREF